MNRGLAASPHSATTRRLQLPSFLWKTHTFSRFQRTQVGALLPATSIKIIFTPTGSVEALGTIRNCVICGTSAHKLCDTFCSQMKIFWNIKTTKGKTGKTFLLIMLHCSFIGQNCSSDIHANAKNWSQLACIGRQAEKKIKSHKNIKSFDQWQLNEKRCVPLFVWCLNMSQHKRGSKPGMCHGAFLLKSSTQLYLGASFRTEKLVLITRLIMYLLPIHKKSVHFTGIIQFKDLYYHQGGRYFHSQ